MEGVPYFSYKPAIFVLDALLFCIDVIIAIFFQFAYVSSVKLIFFLYLLDITLALAINQHEFLNDSLLEVIFLLDKLIEV
jgi:hypothetical protein